MVLQKTSKFHPFFGFVIWGDYGPLTIYRNRKNRLVAYPRTYPEKPPSDLQASIRAAFTVAANEWHHLPKETQDKWELVTRRLSLQVTGMNLYMHWALQWDDSYVRTVQRQAGVELIT